MESSGNGDGNSKCIRWRLAKLELKRGDGSGECVRKRWQWKRK
jgi:hypothetical protein